MPAAVPAIRVLLVDPTLTVRELLQEYLRGRGMAVTAVETVAAARVAWTTERYDVVVCETALPDGEASQVFAQFRDFGCGLLAIAGSLSVPNAIATLRAGAEDILLKPLRVREVYDAVRGAAVRGRLRERERLARGILIGAARCQSRTEATALRAILSAEADLFAEDAVLQDACTRVVALAEQEHN